MDNELYQKTLEYLQRLCSKAEYCSKDIYSKALRHLDGDDEAAKRLLESLIEDGFVDDARYAAAFAREKASLTGWGPVKIRQGLAAKGIRGETATQALAQVDPGKSREKLSRLLQAKAKSLEGDPQAKLKLLKYALSRGYEYDSLKEFVDELV